MIFLPRFWHVICKENGCGSRQHFSITPAFTGVGCVLCSPPQSAELALRSDISKLDCTGLKIDLFRYRWAYIAVFGLILKWKSQAIAYQKYILTFIARIFVNLCKIVEKGQNWEFFFPNLNKKKIEIYKKTFCYGVELLFLFDLSPNTTM